jgi:hypothetical protein
VVDLTRCTSKPNLVSSEYRLGHLGFSARQAFKEVCDMPERAEDTGENTTYEPPKLTRHGKLAEVTQTSPPDALDSTMGPGERRDQGTPRDSDP